MQGEIITIGDELITGRVRDLNSFFLSARVSSYGMKIKSITSVGDDEKYIFDVLARAVSRSDFVLVSGGLGPTEDDITAEVASQFFKRPLVLHELFMDFIRRAVKKRGLPWVESYQKMAFLPEGAELIDPDGEACGFYLYHERVPVIFLPGVPKEVRLLAEAKVLPLLLQGGEKCEVVRQRLFKFFGPQEAHIGKTLEGVSGEEKGVLIGFYPNFPENHVTVTVRASTLAQAEEILARIELEVERRLGRYLVAKDNDTLEDSIGRRLRTRGLKVAAAESCTGGLISHRLTSVSGSSDYFDRGIVAYSNEAKHEVLGVSSATIKARGAVSAETASQMAVGVRKISGADIGVASTGIAGPTGGTKEKPVGTVYVALAAAGGVGVRRYNFLGRRDQITVLTAQTALNWLHRYLTDDTFIFRY